MKRLVRQASQLVTAISLAVPFQAQGQEFVVERPPQFVMLAFDGSLNLAFWKASREFAQQATKEGSSVKFTYFMSGVYFLSKDLRNEYDAPKNGKGKSAIGFGGTIEDLGPRVNQVNRAIDEGHEMASHANGHFDGGSQKWTLADWRSEFSQFIHLIFDIFSINKFSPQSPYTQGWQMKKEDIVGFRAPQLGITSGMWPALKEFGFKYDTSKSDSPSYWPQKDSYGLWQFPLAQLKIAGTGKKTLSMDFNFYVAHSGAADDSSKKELYKKQTYQTYLKYFEDNYNGNRAPLNIGHHFALWNGGAYWEAMKDFAKTVCGLPEVKCVTYKEYMNWLERQDAKTLAAYRKGQFQKSIPVKLADAGSTLNMGVQVARKSNDNLMVRPIVANDKDLLALRARFSINGQMINQSEIRMQDLRDNFERGEEVNVTAHVYNLNGIEVARATQKIKNIGLENEELSTEILESRAMKGDLPEAHNEENNLQIEDLMK